MEPDVAARAAAHAADAKGTATGGDGRKPSTITFATGDPHRDMDYRLSDMGICHLLEDARDGGGDLVLIGKNIFRKDEKRPLIDEIIVPNTGLVEGSVWRD